MTIKTMEMPLCDVCGEIWLPNKGPARDNPRENAKRCGKCKNPRWDFKHVKSIQGETRGPGNPNWLATAKDEKQKKLCKHRSLNCTICEP